MAKHRLFDARQKGKCYITIGHNCMIWHNARIRLVNGYILNGVTATAYETTLPGLPDPQ